MAEILGIWLKEDNSLDKMTLERIRDGLSSESSDFTGCWSEENVGFWSTMVFTTPQSIGEKIPYIENELGCSIVADSRIDYREELTDKLAIDWRTAKNYSDSQLILLAYSKWGEECVRNLYGDFAFAIWDRKRAKLFCARDQVGIRPFYYLHSQNYFAFSSSIKSLSLLDNVHIQVEEKLIIDSIMLQQPNRTNSFYTNIWRLAPASAIAIDSHFNINIQKYWDLLVVPKYSQLGDIQAIEGLKERIHSAVQERLRSGYKVGCELSGGLDSSCIAAHASRVLRKKNKLLIAFTQSLSEEQKLKYYPNKDESDFSKNLASFAAIKDHHYITGENRGIFESIERTLRRISGPYAPDYALITDLIFERAHELGVRIMLSGFGGDEGVSSSGTGFHKELARKGKLKLLVGELNSRNATNKLDSILMSFKILIISGLQPITQAYYKLLFFLGIRLKRYKYIPLQGQLKKKYRTKRLFYYSKVKRESKTLRSNMYSRILSDYIPYRAESTRINSQPYKIEYRYPLLDIKLLEYFYSLPSHLKYKYGIDRYIFRMAAKGNLPESILWRDDKSGFTVPNLHYRIKIDKDKIMELISESIENNKYHYTDYKKLIRIFEILMKRDESTRIEFGDIIFLNSLGILVLQKWQREGKMDLGIKC